MGRSVAVLSLVIAAVLAGCASNGEFSAQDAAEHDASGTLPDGAIAQLEIPSIGVAVFVVEGVDEDDFRRGPGHYPETADLGSSGNAALAGHRTQHGGPFRRLDELEPGDPVILNLAERTIRYRVLEQSDGSGSFIVGPREFSVLDPQGQPMLTLTSCDPVGTCLRRIIVQAVLSDVSAEAAR